MAVLDFPASPTLNQEYTHPTTGTIYIWNGSQWMMKYSVGGMSIPNASTLIAGKIQLATDSDVNAGVNTNKAVTPAQLALALNSATGISDGDKGDVVVSGTGSIWTLKNQSVTASKLHPLALAGKANDTEVVHNSGNEIISGIKTFNSNILLPDVGSDTLDNSNKAASTKFVQNVLAAASTPPIQRFKAATILPNGSNGYSATGGGTWQEGYLNSIVENNIPNFSAAQVFTAGYNRFNFPVGKFRIRIFQSYYNLTRVRIALVKVIVPIWSTLEFKLLSTNSSSTSNDNGIVVLDDIIDIASPVQLSYATIYTTKGTSGKWGIPTNDGINDEVYAEFVVEKIG